MNELFANVSAIDRSRSIETIMREGHIIKALLLQHNPLIINEIFPCLRTDMVDPGFQNEFLAHFLNEARIELAHFETEAQKCEAAGADSRFYTVQMPRINRQLAIDSFENYLEYLQDPAEGYQGIIDILVKDYALQNAGSDGIEYIKEHYPLYRIGTLLYDRYVKRVSLFKRFEKDRVEQLASLYKKELGIELVDTDSQFSKYGLLSMAEGFSIFNNKESQSIVDEKIGSYFSIDVPRELLSAIEFAIEEQWVTNIAFSISLITDSLPALEAVEYGKIFSFNALQLPPVSKLYDDEQYEDSLWIKVGTNPASMTFEELCADFPTLDGSAITQVVHLEFTVESGYYFITHLDHEYILYSEEAYSRRLYDGGVKGQKKLKTFKIDKARIPFDFSFENQYFLFLVLDSYFQNKRLISQYFETMSQRES